MSNCQNCKHWIKLEGESIATKENLGGCEVLNIFKWAASKWLADECDVLVPGDFGCNRFESNGKNGPKNNTNWIGAFLRRRR